jgi:hypothetical protein
VRRFSARLQQVRSPGLIGNRLLALPATIRGRVRTFLHILMEIVTDLTEQELRNYEWVEDGTGFREFLIPASVINARGKVRIIDDRSEETFP